jgi:hypothetical protein
MLRVLGERLTQGLIQPGALLGALTVLSWLLPPAAFLLSGTPAALVTLRRGPGPAVQVMAVAGAMLVAISALAGLGAEPAAGYAAGIWLPAWFCAAALRYTESQGLMLIGAALLALCAVAATHFLLGDVAIWWEKALAAWLETSVPPELAQQYAEMLQPAIPLINGLMIAAVMISVALSVLAARWWQATLFNPGGFRREFHALRLPRALSVPTAAVMALLWFGAGTWQPLLRDALVVVLFVYLFHGVAAVHRTVATRLMSRGWLVAMYLLLAMVPHMAVLLACLGMADSLLAPKSGRGDDAVVH